jgi:hypothetical protein
LSGVIENYLENGGKTWPDEEESEEQKHIEVMKKNERNDWFEIIS